MKIKETFHFDEDEYLNTISGKYFSHTALAKEIYRKRAKKLSAKVHTGMGILTATVTGGASLIGTAISARNISVEKQKLELLEAEWAHRGQPKLPKSKFKDRIIPITIAVGTSLFAVGIDIALSGASPDQIYQFTPNADLNGYIISDYYALVDKAATSAGNFVQGQVVSRGRDYDDNSSSRNNEYDQDEDENYDEDEDGDYDYDRKDYDDDEEEEGEEEESNHGYNSKRYYDDEY